MNRVASHAQRETWIRWRAQVSYRRLLGHAEHLGRIVGAGLSECQHRPGEEVLSGAVMRAGLEASGTCDQFSVWWLSFGRTPRCDFAGPHACSEKALALTVVVRQPRTARCSRVGRSWQGLGAITLGQMNSEIGRELAADSGNSGKSCESLADQAIDSGNFGKP